jgi:hypothetical protein
MPRDMLDIASVVFGANCVTIVTVEKDASVVFGLPDTERLQAPLAKNLRLEQIRFLS